ncbi:hypothetical protein L226DRAFT_576641 [Lentinus tigrinus ALCF2SS1-7]|uniref:uncharacterized protein n=1 Tax=Lentinus tigrinus ALCF2SS1-7 TaxID=1328758 RepID=UPI00116606C4|nr:hypothetical protein L226DRAFT_576641 [Lentinus tigrinus ALCF2SS1-7]
MTSPGADRDSSSPSQPSLSTMSVLTAVARSARIAPWSPPCRSRSPALEPHISGKTIDLHHSKYH